MLKQHGQFFSSLFAMVDAVLIAASWIVSYYLRFFVIAYPPVANVPPIQKYLIVLLPIIFIWLMVFRFLGLYHLRRISSPVGEILDISKASTLALIILIVAIFFFRPYEFSRLVFFYFWAFSIALLGLERWTLREFFRLIRSRGYNLRRAVIVGAGDLGKQVATKIHENPWTGIKVLGYLDDDKTTGQLVNGGRVLGPVETMCDTLKEYDVDQVFIALPTKYYKQRRYVVDILSNEIVSVRIVPDIYQGITLNASVEDFEGLPLINLIDTPVHGWNIILKRIMDFVISTMATIIMSPVLILIATLIKLTSRGPIFYLQERMGLNGKIFKMIKFRSMRMDAEVQSGAVWAKEDDPRRTKVGVFLRKTSLDELPQLFNVLWGDMSIVGPRPERPVFIQDFKSKIPGYILRHKIKAGITGWAQVNGWRGNTALDKRVEYDLYYIEHWSLWFDLKIMWLTVWKGLVHKHAY